MKKVITLLLVFTLLTATLTGCGLLEKLNSGSSSAGIDDITSSARPDRTRRPRPAADSGAEDASSPSDGTGGDGDGGDSSPPDWKPENGEDDGDDDSTHSNGTTDSGRNNETLLPDGMTDDGGEDGTSELWDAQRIQEHLIGLWSCTFEKPDGAPVIDGYILFQEDGSFAMDYGTGYGPAGMGMVMYRGYWHTDPDREPSASPGLLFLDMTLDCEMFANNEEYFPTEINGIFILSFENNRMQLSHLDGGTLYRSDEEEPKWDYDFARDNTPIEFSLWRLSDSELISYVKEYILIHDGLTDPDVTYRRELSQSGDRELWYCYVYEIDGETRYVWLDMINNAVQFSTVIFDIVNSVG